MCKTKIVISLLSTLLFYHHTAEITQIPILKETTCPVKIEETTGDPIIDEIVKTFPECPETAVAIAKAESHLNPNATGYNKNGSIDRGLMQINSVHGYGKELYNVKTNLKVARKIYEKRGWIAWSTFTSGKYKKFLNS